jgi:hypothetical protein
MGMLVSRSTEEVSVTCFCPFFPNTHAVTVVHLPSLPPNVKATNSPSKSDTICGHVANVHWYPTRIAEDSTIA